MIPEIDLSWSLFLDRDGVLNRRLPGAYVRHWGEFEWLPGLPQALRPLSERFGRVFIVTNQQGIGKGIMTEEELAEVHARMLAEARQAGGRIDGAYHCPDLAAHQPNCRKPGPAMALWARRDFPEVDFHKSLMVGDSLSDMQFGQALGMANVLVTTKADERDALERAVRAGLRIDAHFATLAEVVSSICS